MFTVTLSQEMWNNVLLLLAEHPYKTVAPLIQNITNDLRSQMERKDDNVERMRPGA
jgi:hypothetical protein